MTTVLTTLNAIALLALMCSCIARLTDLEGTERPLESVSLILFSFACLGQLTHYVEYAEHLNVIDVVFNVSLMALSIVMTERAWRHTFFNRRKHQVAHLEVDRRVHE